jgi:hypothetical protein
MSNKKTSIPQLNMRAQFQPATIDKEKRTVEMVWTTGAPVMRYPYFEEPFLETLSMDPAAIRMGRLTSGAAPLLAVHDQCELEDVLGVVEKAWLSGNEGRAIVRFSQRADVEPIWQDVQDGILQNISVGYAVYKYERQPQADGQTVPTYLASDWEPMELSLVPVGADSAAGIRSQEGRKFECELINRTAVERGEEEKQMEGTKEQVTPAVSPDLTQVKSEAMAEGAAQERKRVSEIQKAVRVAKLGDTFAEKLITDGVQIDAARAKIIDELATRDEKVETRSQVRVQAGSQDDGLTRREAASSALLHRFDQKKFQLSEAGKAYRHMSMMDLSRALLRSQGINPDFMSKSEIVKRAFTGSDLPAIVLDAANKSLFQGYQEAPQTFDPFVRRASFSDFKTHHRVKMGDAPDLEQVNDDGEIHQGSMSDEKESYALTTYAKKAAITRQTIINDDLDAIAKLPMLWGQRARGKEADLVYAQITANGAMADGNNLFDTANHKNLAGTPAAFSDVELAKMRALMRKQKGLDGARIDIRPAIVLVPVSLETAAEQVTSKLINPTTSTGVNAWLRNVMPVAEPRLDDNSALSYYLIGDKGQCDLIELATLDGQGPTIETREGWDVLGTELRVIYDLGAKVLDWRGFQKNAGA